MEDSVFVIFLAFGFLWVLMGVAGWIAILLPSRHKITDLLLFFLRVLRVFAVHSNRYSSSGKGVKADGEEIRFGKWGLVVAMPIVIPIVFALIMGVIYH